MKKAILRYSVSLLVLFFVTIKNGNAFAQNVKLNSFPAIDLQLPDSSIYQTKDIATGKPVVFLFFHTKCEHCQNEAVDLVKNKEELKKLLLIMISIEDLATIKIFYQKYSLSEIGGLVIGRDYRFGGAKYFMYESFPFCAIYSKRHSFLQSFERNFTTDSIFKVLKSNGAL
jgi:thiol-disulfide isomerase/thioredoxin